MKTQHKQQVRIIGGKWRSRKISFPAIAGLRPSPDRVRETLFNWLAPSIEGAYCLDMFAGSGVLGFEALSRGAQHVVMIDQSSAVIKYLQHNASLLGATLTTIYRATMPFNIKLLPQPFDVVFLDPPFFQGLLEQSCEWLEQQHLVKAGTLIYLEAELGLVLRLPKHWRILKQQQTHQIGYYLVQLDITEPSCFNGEAFARISTL